MLWWWPFSRSDRSGEAGNVLLISGMIATAMAVAGGKVMLDRSLAQRKANQLFENTKRSKEIPGSAAMVAKALVSLPPEVASNKPGLWNTAALLQSNAKMPILYPMPYVSGTLGGAAQPADRFDKTTNVVGSNWSLVEPVGASLKVEVYTNDASRTGNSTISSALSDGRKVVGGDPTIARTKSLVTYSFRNCDYNGATSSTYTGIYCARAEIKSENHASSNRGSVRNPGYNEAVAELGRIEPPPAPLCPDATLPISTPGNAKIKVGDPFSLDAHIAGVAVGYTVRLVSPVAANLVSTGSSKLSLSWNHPRQRNKGTINNIPTDIASNPAVRAALNVPTVTEMELALDLIGADGQTTTCSDVRVQLDKPVVACEPNSFTVIRDPDDRFLRDCNIALRKDNNPGIVTGVRIVKTNNDGVTTETKDFPADFVGNDWTTVDGCGSDDVNSEDGWTYQAYLIREYPAGVSISDSQCSPNQSVPELPPVCVGNSVIVSGRQPAPPMSNLLNCAVQVSRTLASHNNIAVMVNTGSGYVDRTALGTWTETETSDDDWNAFVPCPSIAGGTINIKLTRAGHPDSECGLDDITTAVDSASCVANSLKVRRTAAQGQCTLSLKKPASGTTMVDVVLTGLPAGASAAGTWSGNTWTTSSSFACSTGNTFSASLSSPNGTTSSCGSTTLPPVPPPDCQDLVATRPTNTSTTCSVVVSKGPTSGAITSAVVNGSQISTADLASYTTTVACPLNSATTVTGSLANSSGSDLCPSSRVDPVPQPVPLYLNSNRCAGGGPFYSLTATNYAGCTREYRDNAQIWHYTNDKRWFSANNDSKNGNARLEYCAGSAYSPSARAAPGDDYNTVVFSGISRQIGTCTGSLASDPLNQKNPPAGCTLTASFRNCFYSPFNPP